MGERHRKGERVRQEASRRFGRCLFLAAVAFSSTTARQSSGVPSSREPQATGDRSTLLSSPRSVATRAASEEEEEEEEEGNGGGVIRALAAFRLRLAHAASAVDCLRASATEGTPPAAAVAAEEAAASEENLLRHPTAIMEEALRRSSCRGGRPGNILTLFTYYEARDERD